MRTVQVSRIEEASHLIDSPEKSLLFALIENALNDYLLPTRASGLCEGGRRVIKRKAKNWLFRPDKAPFSEYSFGWVLAMIGSNRTLKEVQEDIRSIIWELEEQQAQLKEAA